MKRKLTKKLVKVSMNYGLLGEMLILALIMILTGLGLFLGSTMIQSTGLVFRLIGLAMLVVTGVFYVWSRSTWHLPLGMEFGEKLFKFFSPRVYKFGHGWVF